MMKHLFIFALLLSGPASYAFGLTECWDESCHTKGWTHHSLDKNQYTDYMCREDDCARSGWIAGGTEGIYLYTQCMDKGCFRDGWYEVDRATQQLLQTVVCRKGDCLTSGWDAYTPNGQSFAECRKDNCSNQGWILTLPDRRNVSATCQGKGCFITGWIESTY